MSAPTPSWESEALDAFALPPASPNEAAISPKNHGRAGIASLIVALVPVPLTVLAIAAEVRTAIDPPPSPAFWTVYASWAALLAAPIAIGLSLGELQTLRRSLPAKAGFTIGLSSAVAIFLVPILFRLYWDVLH